MITGIRSSQKVDVNTAKVNTCPRVCIRNNVVVDGYIAAIGVIYYNNHVIRPIYGRIAIYQTLVNKGTASEYKIAHSLYIIVPCSYIASPTRNLAGHFGLNFGYHAIQQINHVIAIEVAIVQVGVAIDIHLVKIRVFKHLLQQSNMPFGVIYTWGLRVAGAGCRLLRGHAGIVNIMVKCCVHVP